MPTKFKLYTIEITHPDTWYKQRVGEVFDARLDKKENGIIAFKINQSPFFFISILHCKVVNEKIVETS